MNLNQRIEEILTGQRQTERGFTEKKYVLPKGMDLEVKQLIADVLKECLPEPEYDDGSSLDWNDCIDEVKQAATKLGLEIKE